MFSAFSTLVARGKPDRAFLPTLRHLSSYPSSRKVEHRFPFVSANCIIAIIAIVVENSEDFLGNDIMQRFPKRISPRLGYQLITT